MARKKRFGFLVDLRRCIGCQSCSIACKQEWSVPVGRYRSWVKQVAKGSFPNTRKSFLPVLCNNCDKPICVTVCPVLASYQKPDGIVEIDPHKCIGCRYCMASCPYGVRYLHPDLRIAQKCNWCSHRTESGFQPACVDACPASARIFGDLGDPSSEINRQIAQNGVQPIKPEMGTSPRTFYIGLDDITVETKANGHELMHLVE
jgi:tetrathionate reductase subunit B